MGWNDHEPWFSIIEDKVEALVEEGYAVDEAYSLALDEVTSDMRDNLPGRWS